MASQGPCARPAAHRSLGERDIPSVNQQRSLQNRVNNFLALMVVTLVGGGFLYFYYSNLSHKQADAKAKVVQERTAKATG